MEDLDINQRVQIKVPVYDGKEMVFNTHIKRVYKDRLAIKTTEEMFVYSDYLKEADEIFVTIFTPLGMISFESIIINSIFEPEFVIEYAEDGVVVQRRKFLRIPCRTKLVFELSDGTNQITNTVDLSAGAIRFYSIEHFEEEKKVYFRLFLPMQIDSISAQGVVRTETLTLPPNEHLLVFTKISERDVDRIAKVCMDYELPKDLAIFEESEAEVDLEEHIEAIHELLKEEELAPINEDKNEKS